MAATRYYWIVRLFMISVIAYIMADLTSFIIAERLGDLKPHTFERERSIVDRPAIKPSLRSYDIIFKKNIFRPGGEEKSVQEETVSPQDKSHITPLQEVPLSPLNLRLVGTTVKGSRGYMAFFEDKGSRVQNGYRIGDEIEPGVKLIDIYRKRVLIERNGIVEELLYPAEEDHPLKGRSQRNKGKVSPVSQTNRVLDKRYVDNELKDMGRLMTQIRAVPSGKDGFKVFNIARGSMFDKIGLNNGDIVKRINGMELSSPDKAMEMYMQLKGSTNIRLDIIRKGNLMSYEYAIR